MYTVYETIKALGTPMPRRQAPVDRYFGKEPLDFTPPQRLRRRKNACPTRPTSPASARS